MPEGFAIHGTDIERMKPHEILLFLGGLLTILLGAVFFGISWFQGIRSADLLSRVVTLVVDVVLGIFLWVAYLVDKKNHMNAGILAVVMSLILLIFGGTPGQIGGVVGLLGGCLAIALPYLPVKA